MPLVASPRDFPSKDVQPSFDHAILPDMHERSSRDEDENEAATRIVAEATAAWESRARVAAETITSWESKARPKNQAAVALGRLGGLKGGKARAAKLSPKRRKQIAAGAAAARWKKRK